MSVLNEFINSYFLWRDPMIVGVVSGSICGFLGVYVVLKRIVFVSAMLTQISGFGVVLAFYLQGFSTLFFLTDPSLLSLFLTCAAVLIFSLTERFLYISQESVIGWGYILASGLVIVIGDRITQGSHDVASVLFGTAVVVERHETITVTITAVVSFLIHWFLFKDFIFVSFDPELAGLFRYPVRGLNAILFLSIGVVVAIITRALGALPVFALLVLPPVFALLVTDRLKLLFVISPFAGLLSAALGYFLSFVLSLPTGASIALVAVFLTVLGGICRRFGLLL
jgi:zinc transport system permease protein